MVANNQKGLKELLSEAKDHKVVNEQVIDGTTYLFIPYHPTVLQKIVEDNLDATE